MIQELPTGSIPASVDRTGHLLHCFDDDGVGDRICRGEISDEKISFSQQPLLREK